MKVADSKAERPTLLLSGVLNASERPRDPRPLAPRARRAALRPAFIHPSIASNIALNRYILVKIWTAISIYKVCSESPQDTAILGGWSCERTVCLGSSRAVGGRRSGGWHSINLTTRAYAPSVMLWGYHAIHWAPATVFNPTYFQRFLIYLLRFSNGNT